MFKKDGIYPKYMDRVLSDNKIDRETYNNLHKRRALFRAKIEEQEGGECDIEELSKSEFDEKIKELISFDKETNGLATPDVVQNAFTEMEDIYSEDFRLIVDIDECEYEGVVEFKKRYDAQELIDILNILVRGCKKCHLELIEYEVNRDEIFSFKLGVIGTHERKYGEKKKEVELRDENTYGDLIRDLFDERILRRMIEHDGEIYDEDRYNRDMDKYGRYFNREW